MKQRLSTPLLAALVFGLSGPVYADLFALVTVQEREPRSEFERFLLVYRNTIDQSFLVNLQVDNPTCDVGGKGVIVQTLDDTDKTVRSEVVPGYEARSLSLTVPPLGKIRLKFKGETSGGTVFDDCDNTFPRGTYQLSEPK